MNPDPDTVAALSEAGRRLLESALRPLTQGGCPETAEMIRSLAATVAQDTERWLDIQSRYCRGQIELWASLCTPDAVKRPTPLIAPDPSDRRFRGPEWREPYFSYLVQSYLLGARWMRETLDAVRAEPHAKRKLDFYARQWMDAMAPSNFAWSNPEALRLAAETGGDSLARGLRNLAADMDKGLVSMTDERAFEVGGNLAVTPGAVVFENDFMQLIQYRPATQTVHRRPLVMVPPCINKYYILDLQPENSFVRYAVAEGHTVFMVSWRNMPPSMGRATWDDYLEHGVIRALDAALDICGADKVNALGFCVGGTLLGCALAVLRAKGRDPAHSVTLLATMLDFCDTGELAVFVDEAYVSQRERDFAAGGVLHGRELALTFASLRANELIWRYVVDNYLKGKTPEAFDLLYWNSDSTNLPGAMYVYYLRNMYLENNLRVPGRLTMCGAPVDLGMLDMPAFVLAAREDHIVPWPTAYASARLLRGAVEFVLAASGHIAGVINPASRNRRSFWLNPALGNDAEAWLAEAQPRSGSWWGHWSAWLAPHGGGRVAARAEPGGGRYPPIEPAPGRYVKEKCG
jgi:polyhydroxyalkanoate synthase